MSLFSLLGRILGAKPKSPYITKLKKGIPAEKLPHYKYPVVVREIIPEDDPRYGEIDIDPKWTISIAFPKSSSDVFEQVLEIAKKAPEYPEEKERGKILFRASYTANPDHLLDFAEIYNLTGRWKSRAITIKNEPADLADIDRAISCYEERCRSGTSRHCFGGDIFTQNPFGCHQLELTEYYQPWYTFVKGRNELDKEAIKKRITPYFKDYSFCPAFSRTQIIQRLENLPDKIPKKLLGRTAWMPDPSIKIVEGLRSEGQKDVQERKIPEEAMRTEISRRDFFRDMMRGISVGSTQYRWRTAMDGGVRSSHRKMEGKRVAWNAPPIVDGAPTHAGTAKECRCYAEPIIKGI
jgi:hypothetical protein